MPIVTSPDGTRIAYTTAGSGPPLLLLPGATHTWQSWEALGYIDALQGDFRLILPDLRGHGESGSPHDPAAHAMPVQAADMLAVLDDLGITRTHVWGLSLGGQIAFHLAASHPDRVESLVIWGAHPYPATPEDRELITDIVATLREGMPAWVASLDEGGVLDVYADPEFRRKALLAADVESLVAAVIASGNDPGVTEALPQMTMPTLLLVGAGDDEVLDHAQQAARLLSNANFVVVGGIGHAMVNAPMIVPYVRAFYLRHGILSSRE